MVYSFNGVQNTRDAYTQWKFTYSLSFTNTHQYPPLSQTQRLHELQKTQETPRTEGPLSTAYFQPVKRKQFLSSYIDRGFSSNRPRGKTLPLFLSQTREVSSMVTATKNRTNHFATYVSGSRSFLLTDTFPSLADTCGYSRHNGSLHFTGKWGCRSRGRRNEVTCDEKSFRTIVDNIIIPRLETNRLHFDRLPLCSRIYTLDTWPILHKLSFIDGILTKRTE